MSIHRVLLLLAMFFTLISFSGCSDDDDDKKDDDTTEIVDPNEPNSTEPTPIERVITGLAIDGYLDGSDVDYCGDLVKSSNGKFEVPFNKDCKKSFKISGGIDTATGELFEGVIKAPAPTDENDTEIVATPLTTLVASLVESGKSSEEAEKSVASSLGLTPEDLNRDPIETLNSSSSTPEEKKASAQAIKKALVVQKLTETASKSVSEDKKDAAFSAIMSSIANKLDVNGSDFESIVTDKDSMDSIMEDVANDENSGLGSEDLEKLKASASAAQVVASIVNDIDETELESSTNITETLELKSKSIEAVTSKIEESVESGNLDEVEDFEKAIIMFGGLEGIESSMEKTGDTEDINATAFAESFLDETNIEAQVNTYNVLEKTLADANLSTDDINSYIKNIGIQLSESTADLNDTDSISSIITDVVGDSVEIDLDSIADAVKDAEETKAEKIEDAKEDLNSAPKFDGKIADINGKVGEPIINRNFNSFFSDADKDELTITLTCTLPAGLTFNNGILSGTPTEATKAESVIPCMVEADDGKRKGKSNPFKIQIDEADEVTDPDDENETTETINTAPTLSSNIADITGTFGTAISKDLTSHFSDVNDTLTYSMSCNPAVTTITLSQGTLNITSATAVGTSTCTVTAKDTADQSVSDEFTITISSATTTTAPTLSSTISDQYVVAGQSYSKSFSGYFSGATSYGISCSSTVSTMGLTFSGSTLSGTPNSNSLSNCRVSATNSGGTKYSNYFSITSGGDAGASATVNSENNITVGSIEINSSEENSSTVTNGVFSSITKGKLSGSSFSDIEDELGAIYNLKVTVENSSALSDVNEKEITLGALVHDTSNNSSDDNSSSRFVLVAIPALMSKSGDSLTVEATTGATVTMVGRDVSANNGQIFKAELTNDSANIKTGTASSGKRTWTVGLDNVFKAFSNDNEVGTYIENIIFDTATKSGSYEIYIFLGDKAFSGTDAIDFTNDKGFDLSAITGLSSSSNLNTEVGTIFGSTTVNGFKGTLILK